MASINDAPRVQVTSAAELRAWLARNHRTSPPIWLVTFKKHCADRYTAWPDIVRACLCFGWIDSRARSVDDDRTSVYLAPRKAGSVWSAVNKRLVDELIASGEMTAAGLQPIAAAKADGSWTLLDDAEALIEPPDLTRALDASPDARSTWDQTPASVRKRVLTDLALVKRDTTRARRIERAVADCAAGRRPA